MEGNRRRTDEHPQRLVQPRRQRGPLLAGHLLAVGREGERIRSSLNKGESCRLRVARLQASLGLQGNRPVA